MIDGILMSSPLAVVTANVFIGYYEDKLFEMIPKPKYYVWYVDDTFTMFSPDLESRQFFSIYVTNYILH